MYGCPGRGSGGAGDILAEEQRRHQLAVATEDQRISVGADRAVGISLACTVEPVAETEKRSGAARQGDDGFRRCPPAATLPVVVPFPPDPLNWAAADNALATSGLGSVQMIGLGEPGRLRWVIMRTSAVVKVACVSTPLCAYPRATSSSRMLHPDTKNETASVDARYLIENASPVAFDWLRFRFTYSTYYFGSDKEFPAGVRYRKFRLVMTMSRAS